MARPFHPNIVAECPTLTTERAGQCGILSDEALQFFPPETMKQAIIVVVDKDNMQVALLGQKDSKNASHEVIVHKKASLKDCLVHDQTARAVTVTFPSEGPTNGAYFYDL